MYTIVKCTNAKSLSVYVPSLIALVGLGYSMYEFINNTAQVPSEKGDIFVKQLGNTALLSFVVSTILTGNQMIACDIKLLD
jgi:polyferredoxin